jgi:hypothetical protein
MARMIPEHFDESTTSIAERVLYYKLQDELDADWTVIHSLPYVDGSRTRLRQGECDFVLLHPRRGMLVLEAKSGTPSYVAAEREWVYEDGSRLKDPFNQAQAGAHYLNGLLEKGAAAWYDAALPFGYAVAFPDARAVQGNLDPKMALDLLLLETDLAQVQRTVERVLARFSDPSPRPRPDAVAAALHVLQPVFRLVPALGSTIDLARRRLLRLTEEQADVLDGLAGNPRLVVRGGAGTGKTLLIVARARALAAAGKRVLVLCFNRPLAAYLADELAGNGGLVTAANFHAYCLDLVREAGAAEPDPQAAGYWDRLLPDAALGAIGDYEPRYDAILVDESQDFLAEWWLLIESLLADDADAQLHVFGDDRQDIYGRDNALPFTRPSFELRRNCRNTAPVAAFARRAAGLDVERALRGLPAGPEPVIHEVEDADAEWEAVRKTLHRLVNEQGIAPADIAILGGHRLDKSSFARRRKLGNLSVREAGEPDAPNTIRYETVHRFKGLEADCILLTGIGQPSDYYREEHWRRFEYIGGSRARVVLHVFRRPGAGA